MLTITGLDEMDKPQEIIIDYDRTPITLRSLERLDKTTAYICHVDNCRVFITEKVFNQLVGFMQALNECQSLTFK